jgi:hypothetical protein
VFPVGSAVLTYRYVVDEISTAGDESAVESRSDSVSSIHCCLIRLWNRAEADTELINILMDSDCNCEVDELSLTEILSCLVVYGIGDTLIGDERHYPVQANAAGKAGVTDASVHRLERDELARDTELTKIIRNNI